MGDDCHWARNKKIVEEKENPNHGLVRRQGQWAVDLRVGVVGDFGAPLEWREDGSAAHGQNTHAENMVGTRFNARMFSFLKAYPCWLK